MRTGIRFDPPALELTAEQAWVLARAFGPTGDRAPGPAVGVVAADAAEQLHLAARIGSRIPRPRLEAEVGEEAADRFAERYRAAAAVALARLTLARRDELSAPGPEAKSTPEIARRAGDETVNLAMITVYAPAQQWDSRAA